MGFFTSDYEEQAPRYTREQMNRIGALKSDFEGINDLTSLSSKFGLTPFDLKGYRSDVSNLFGTKKRALGSSLGRSRAALTNRLGGQSANPEYAFSGLEGSYADAYAGLEGAEAGQLLAGEDRSRENERYTAGLLESIFGKKDAFKLNKENSRTQAMQAYLRSLDDTSGFDDLLALGGTAARFVQPFKL